MFENKRKTVTTFVFAEKIEKTKIIIFRLNLGLRKMSMHNSNAIFILIDLKFICLMRYTTHHAIQLAYTHTYRFEMIPPYFNNQNEKATVTTITFTYRKFSFTTLLNTLINIESYCTPKTIYSLGLRGKVYFVCTEKEKHNAQAE